MLRRNLLATGVLALFVAAAVAGEEETKLKWLKSWDEAVTTAKKESKPIFVDVFTTWCGPCKMLDKRTFTDDRFKKFAQHVVLLKQDAEKEGRDLAKKYEVGGYPTLLLVGADGELMGRMMGFQPAEPLVAGMTKIIDATKRLPALTEALKKTPNDPKLNMEYADALFTRGSDAEGMKVMAKLDELGVNDPAMAPLYLRMAEAVYKTTPREEQEGAIQRILELGKRAEAIANEPKSKAEAHLLQAQIQMMLGDQAAARKHAQAVTALADAPKQQKAYAERILASLKAAES